MTYTIDTQSSHETKQVGEKLAHYLHGGEIIELVSDLGGGKTTFVQGLAAGLGYDGEVTSPTFTLSRVYKLDEGLELHHYDLYRLGASGAVGDELLEDISTPGIVTVIEWGAIIEADLPTDRLQVTFNVTGDTDRELVIKSAGPISNRLIEEMKA